MRYHVLLQHGMYLQHGVAYCFGTDFQQNVVVSLISVKPFLFVSVYCCFVVAAIPTKGLDCIFVWHTVLLPRLMQGTFYFWLNGNVMYLSCFWLFVLIAKIKYVFV